jgi:hypothetical protein
MGEDTRQDRQDASGHPSTERVSVPQAADHLGTTVDAIRKRVQRRTIPYEKDADGRVWILLDTGRPRQDATGHRHDSGASPELVEELRDRIAFLEGQLRRRDEEIGRRDAVLLNMTEAMKALNPPREAQSREEPSESAETRSGTSAPPDAGGQESGTERPEEERKGFFRRFFGL